MKTFKILIINIIAGYLKNVNYTKEDLAKIDSDDEYLLQHVSMVGLYLGIELNTVGELKEILYHDLEQFNEHLNFHLNKEFKGRKTGNELEYHHRSSEYSTTQFY